MYIYNKSLGAAIISQTNAFSVTGETPEVTKLQTNLTNRPSKSRQQSRFNEHITYVRWS